MKEGWHWPIDLRKGHYFRQSGKSLCGKHDVGANWSYEPGNPYGGSDECKECRRRLNKRPFVSPPTEERL